MCHSYGLNADRLASASMGHWKQPFACFPDNFSKRPWACVPTALSETCPAKLQPSLKVYLGLALGHLYAEEFCQIFTGCFAMRCHVDLSVTSWECERFNITFDTPTYWNPGPWMLTSHMILGRENDSAHFGHFHFGVNSHLLTVIKRWGNWVALSSPHFKH